MLHVEHTYAELPPEFWADATPSVAVSPELIAFNDALADELGLELGDADRRALAELFSGARLPDDARPVALAYAGHQFGNFVPQLGDGRAILLGEVVSPSGRRFDLHLKGAGATRFSRGGDGRAALGPVLREFVVSEAMHALRIPTTRSLAAVATGGTVLRERPLPGAVLTRVASSHIRVGTFEYFAARGQTDNLRRLADYAIARHYPELRDAADPYLEFFRAVAARQLALVARWIGVGFIHGVMNTDNTSIAGETIDYGPCAFLDTYRPDQVFSSIDHIGRYRYQAQGRVALWNLSILASCLVPLVADGGDGAVDVLTDAMNALPSEFERERLAIMAAKLGIVVPRPDDAELVSEWLDHMTSSEVDFTVGFRELARSRAGDSPFHHRWRVRLDEQGLGDDEVGAQMRQVNPARIPRNHRVEEMIEAALEGDLAPFQRLRAALAAPYDEAPAFADYELPPRPDEVVHATFCGT